MMMWPVSSSIAMLVLGLVNMQLVTCFVVPDSHVANKQGGISRTKLTRRWFVSSKQENDHCHRAWTRLHGVTDQNSWLDAVSTTPLEIGQVDDAALPVVQAKSIIAAVLAEELEKIKSEQHGGGVSIDTLEMAEQTVGTTSAVASQKEKSVEEEAKEVIANILAQEDKKIKAEADADARYKSVEEAKATEAAVAARHTRDEKKRKAEQDVEMLAKKVANQKASAAAKLVQEEETKAAANLIAKNKKDMDLQLAEETKKAEAAAKHIETKMLDARKLAQKYQVDVTNRQQARLEDLHARRKRADAKLAHLRNDRKDTRKKEENKNAPIELKQPTREGGNIKLRSANTVRGRAKKETGDINPKKDHVSSAMKDLTINSEKATAVLGIFERHWSVMMAYAFLRLLGWFARSLIFEGVI
eukprot:scaffold339811_cov55-Attheya_sp.AAC.2